MIFKYKAFVEAGVNGFILHGKLGETDALLGVIDGWNYVHSIAPQVQDSRIQWSDVTATITDAEKEILKSQLPHKSFARLKLSDIGDIQDFLADAMKLIEFNMMLTARLAGDIWGTNPIDATKKQEFADRNKTFIDAVDSGALTLRGTFDDMSVIMTRMMGRLSKTNEIIRDNYVNELKKIELQ